MAFGRMLALLLSCAAVWVVTADVKARTGKGTRRRSPTPPSPSPLSRPTHSHAGGYFSLSQDVLKRSAKVLVPKLVKDIKSIVIPGVNQSLFSIDPIRFEDISIGDYDISIESGKGVQVSLTDMSNVIAHTNLVVDVKLIKCTGQIWASATGASFKAMNTIVVDEQGNGKLKTVTPEGGFDVGDIEVHHKMNGLICEAAADVLHVVDGVVIDLIKNTLQAHLASIIATAVDIPSNFLIKEIEQPPALGFGKEKFKLDNTFVDVNYDNHRITHMNRAEFKSTLHPVESKLTPPKIASAGERDLQIGFTDYVVDTLFDALYAEKVGEEQIKVPYIKTIFDKECPKCPIVLKSTFGSAARQTFHGGVAEAHLTDVNLEVGALNNHSKVLPMVTLSVNVSAGVGFSLVKTASNYGIKSSLALGNFSQTLLISHIGKVDMSDLTRDIKLVLSSVFNTLNKDIPALPIPAIAGVTLAKPEFTIGERTLLLEADFVLPDSVEVNVQPSIVLV